MVREIKVLILAGEMDVGGIENQLMHLLRCSNKDKFRIDFTSTVNYRLFYQDEMESLGAKIIRLPSTEGWRFIRYCRALFRVLLEERYDIIHSHELFHSGMVLLTARIAGVKHRFVHAHNWSDDDGSGTKKSVKRRIYNYVMQRLIQMNATDFVACSSFAGHFLFGEKVMKQSNYHLVFNSVDTSKYVELYDQIESGEFCDDGWINVLQVGRFTPVKNQLFTVEIAKELKSRGEKIRFLCAGNVGGDYDDAVVAKIREYGLEEHVLLLGVRKDVDVLMRKSAAFLLPSRYEGMPLVLIEAQASGLPCVTADTYSREVDFGIKMVNWLKLEDSASVCADAVEKAIGQGRAEKEDVVRAIEKGGFDSRVFAKKICDLYEKSVNG